MKYFLFIFLFSFNANSRTYIFDVLNNNKTLGENLFKIDGVKNSTKAYYANIPIKHILISTKKGLVPKVTKEMKSIELPSGVKFYEGEGEKCRCRLDLLREPTVLNKFNYSEEMEYLGDFRGKDLYRYSVPLVRKKSFGEIDAIKELKIKVQDGVLVSEQQEVFKLNKKLLIVLPKTFSSSKDRLVSYYEDKGYKVSAIEDESIISNRESLRKELKSSYLSEKISYVVFVGNSSHIRPYYLDTKFDSSTPSDYPYFLLNDDSRDIFPDVIGSRISVASNEELLGFIAKGQGQKKFTMNKFLGVSSNEGVNPSDEEYVDSIGENLMFDGEAAHLNQDNSDSNADTFIASLNSGVDFVTYVGHGSGFSWRSFNQDVTVSDLDNWNIGNRNPIVIDVACQNGKFDGRGHIGEKMISGSKDNNFKNGAISYIGGSVDISWNPPAIFAQGMAEQLEKTKQLIQG